jgi:hypothetical protein
MAAAAPITAKVFERFSRNNAASPYLVFIDPSSRLLDDVEIQRQSLKNRPRRLIWIVLGALRVSAFWSTNLK